MKLTGYRRITQTAFILLIFLLPVLNVFRFDVDTRELIVFGKVWSLGLHEGFYTDRGPGGVSHVALQFFLKAILPWLGVLAVFPLLGVFTGRFFCGWFCPEGTLFELFDYLTVKIFGRRSLFANKPNDPEGPAAHRLPYIILALSSMVLIPLFFGVALTCYFVNPKVVWDQIINWNFTFGVKAGIIGVAVYIFISSMIVRHTLCKFVCSAGLMQMLFGWASPVSIRVKTDIEKLAACTDCKKCDKVCFMNVKPRLLRKDINCVNCGECITACTRELGEGRGVFSFSQSRHCMGPSREPARKPGDALYDIRKSAQKELTANR